MNGMVPDLAISELSDYIRNRMGIYFPRERWAELKRKVVQAADTLGFPDDASCIQWVLSSKSDKLQLELLASCLTVGETYFFREANSLQALTDRVFPELIRSHSDGDRRIRIWSAGCSSGEEPYTVAMMVLDCPGLKGWDVGILGTDINQAVLRKAEAGVYSDWSFRGVDPGIRERYFVRKAASSYEVVPALKDMVTFAHLNLIDDSYPALLNSTNAIDLILCRNVLMYFSPDSVRNVLGKFRQSLVPDGWLLVSAVEASTVGEEGFSPLMCAGAVLHRRTGEKVVEAKGPDRPAAPPARSKPRQSEPKGSGLEQTAIYQCAIDFYEEGNHEGAIPLLGTLAARPGAETPVFALLSRCYANKGLLTQAEEWCRRAIDADKLNAASRYLLALILIEKLEPEDAMNALRKAIYLEPNFAIAHYTMANLHHRKQNEAESRRHLKHALSALKGLAPEEELPESEGITAGKLMEMIALAGADGRADGRPHVDR